MKKNLQPDIVINFPCIRFYLNGDWARRCGQLEYTALAFWDPVDLWTIVFVQADPNKMQSLADRQNIFKQLEIWYLSRGIVTPGYSFAYFEKGYNVTKKQKL